jgi:two-component system response regulator NreC
MDIAMPNMDGLEAIRRIKKKNPKIRILVLTQHDNKEYVLSAIKAGSSGYVTKSALGSELVSAVRTVYNGEAFLYPTAATALVGGYLHHSEEDPYDSLTNREKEVLKLVAEGYTSRQIGEQLLLCEKTVTGHRTRLMGKLDLHNRTELVKYAIRKGLAA